MLYCYNIPHVLLSCASAADVPACLRSADAAAIQACDHVNTTCSSPLTHPCVLRFTHPYRATALPFSPVIDGVNLPDDPIALAQVRCSRRSPPALIVTGFRPAHSTAFPS